MKVAKPKKQNIRPSGTGNNGIVLLGAGNSYSSLANSSNANRQPKRIAVDTHKIVYGRTKVSGTVVYLDTKKQGSLANAFCYYVIVLAGHEIESIEELYVNDKQVFLDANNYVYAPAELLGKSNIAIDDPFANPSLDNRKCRIRIVSHLGSPTQTVDPGFQYELPGTWDESHRLQGLAYLAIRMRYDANVFTNGIPAFSAVIKGKKLYDPRTGLTQWSDNAALVARDYITTGNNDPNYNYGINALPDEIDEDSFIAAANICDEDVLLSNGETQKRYTANGVVDTGQSPADILTDIASSMGAKIFFAQGHWSCYPGAYTAPVADIDSSWLRDGITVTCGANQKDVFNGVQGVIIDEVKNWQATDFPIVTNNFYKSQDNGEEILANIDLPFTTDSVRAQRLAKMMLDRSRQAITLDLPFNWKALQLGVNDTFRFTNSKYGFENKIFKIQEWKMGSKGFSVVAQEESSASYDWNAGNATTYDTAPNTSLPDVNILEPPGNPVITEELYISLEGSGVKTKALLTWSESPNAMVNTYVVEYREPGGTDFLFGGETSNNSLTLFDLTNGSYTFRVKAKNWRQVSSDWASTIQEIKGLTDPPNDITGFTVNIIHNQAHCNWDLSSDLDVRVGGSIEIRWTSKTSSPNWSDGVALGPDVAGSSTNSVLPALNGTYMVKAKDSVGKESVNAAKILVGNVNLFQLNTAYTVDEAPSFAGSKTNLRVDTSDHSLTFDSIGLFDDADGFFDDSDGLFDTGAGMGVETAGEYVFASYIDLKNSYLARINTDLDFGVFGIYSLFDSQAGMFDDFTGQFDGEDPGNITAQWYVKTTDADPTGSHPDDGIWSDWRKFYIGDFSARAYWFKVVFASNQESNNFKVYSAKVDIVLPERSESFASQAISSSGTTLTYSKPFLTKPNVSSLLISSTVSGDTPEYTHVTSSGKYTGLTVKILNGGSGQNRNVDLIIKGY